MRRREFLIGMAAPPLLGSAQSVSDRGKLERFACNSWPFRGYFNTPEMKQYRDAKDPLLTQAEFPEFLADHFGIHNVEFLPQHFEDTDAGTIEKVKAGLRKANSRCCNLMGVEVSGGVFAAQADRQAIAREIERWARIAQHLEAPSITIALTGTGTITSQMAAANLKAGVDAAYHLGIKILFHNDDLKHESAEILTPLIELLGKDRAGACPDFGNFATQSAAFALKQLRLLAPFASNICHAKDGIAEGSRFYPDDFAGSIKVMRDAGFRGIYSLEFEGLGDPVAGVRKLMRLTQERL